MENALRVFAKMNYEKASQMEIAKACGLSKAGLIYYFPLKLDLFVAVVDKYVFNTQQLENKFKFTGGSFSEFIDQYVEGVENTMNRLVHMLNDGNNPNGCCFNFYYYHLLMQVRLYYPNVEKSWPTYSSRISSCGRPPSKRQKKTGKCVRTWMWKKRPQCSGKSFSAPLLNNHFSRSEYQATEEETAFYLLLVESLKPIFRPLTLAYHLKLVVLTQ